MRAINLKEIASERNYIGRNFQKYQDLIRQLRRNHGVGNTNTLNLFYSPYANSSETIVEYGPRAT